MRKLSYLIIIIGVLVMLYPKASEWMNDREQQKLLEAAEQAYTEPAAAPSSTPDPDLTKSYAAVTELLAEGADEADEPQPSATATPDIKPGGKVIAVITIDKIGLKLPVLEGATKANMKYAAAHMKETTTFGEVGNAAIAAHRARTTGRLFNRLNEVEIGDVINIQTSGEKYQYKVYDISIVEPTDVSVLKGNGKDQLLTLITCDPLVHPTHRLIVHAKLL